MTKKQDVDPAKHLDGVPEDVFEPARSEIAREMERRLAVAGNREPDERDQRGETPRLKD